MVVAPEPLVPLPIVTNESRLSAPTVQHQRAKQKRQMT